MTPPYRPDGADAVPVPDVAAFPRSTMEEDVAAEHYDEIDVRLDPRTKTYWCMMRPDGRPSYTPGLLADLSRMQGSIPRLFARHARSGEEPMRYFVVGSRIPGIFNLGGDLALFAHHIRQGNRKHLSTYARACIDVVYNNAVNYELPIVTIALVQGDALGGGFEAALSCDIIVAERGAKFGLPEVLFNMFPGMGAYSFLARRLDSVQAERMIMSGKLYTAQELFDFGLIDILAEDGKGRLAAEEYIRRNTKRQNSHSAIYRTRRRVNPITYEELRDITDIWVDTALRLSEPDLRKMMRLTMAQDRRRSAVETHAAEAV
ncbi:crotonase/enoyl-CoA hydratase family protein [Breoghania sp.]|uniref:crotonase/enoyl-CoA hydratase family protein n=1 Tax=Breoghania sp. TaxID=2065378 RepID=UPI002AAA96F2|nr:crotonase/enoyl-CoA hydratase family protein [Breoghania sp.]